MDRGCDGSSRKRVLVGAIWALALADVALAAGLALGGARASSALAGEAANEPPVGEERLKNFAMVYMASYETYTPSTVEASAKELLKLVSPEHHREVSDLLERRADVVRRGSISSLFAPDPGSLVAKTLEEGRVQVSMQGERKVFFSDVLNRSSRVLCTVSIARCAPTLANRQGLYVVGHSVTETREAAHE